MKVVKKITNMALANDWMEKNPFINIHFHEQEVHKEFLTKEELETMQNKVFDVPRLDLVQHSSFGYTFSHIGEIRRASTGKKERNIVTRSMQPKAKQLLERNC